MGYIYTQAISVIVVFESAEFSTITHSIETREPLTGLELDTLEHDTWCTRIWTYQELCNARTVDFTAYAMQRAAKISGDDFFNNLGFSLQRCKTRLGVSALGLMAKYPVLSALEDACADWFIGMPTERSMLTCLTGINGRQSDPRDPANVVYALFGALTTVPCWGATDESVSDLTEKAMHICEAKADFSHIFTANPRSSSRRWRPDGHGNLVPILQWHSYGSRQGGFLSDDRVTLRDMVRLEIGRLPSDDITTRVSQWTSDFDGIATNEAGASSVSVPRLVSVLRSIRWTGCEQVRTCEQGYILLQYEVSEGQSIEAFVSTVVRWTFGCPGIARILSSENCIGYSPLILVGHVPYDDVNMRQVDLFH